MTKRLIAAFSAGASLLAFGAAEAQDTTLLDALRDAYETNPTLEAERHRYSATREAIARARAGGLPQVTAQYSYRDSDQTQTVPNGAFGDTIDANGDGVIDAGDIGLSVDNEVELETTTLSVEATQTIFAGLSNWNAIRSAKAEVRAGEAQLVNVEQQILLQAATAYLDVLRDVSVLELRKNNVKVLAKQLDAANARFDVGEVTRTDVSQAEARLSTARAQVFQASAQLEASRAIYEQVVGSYPIDLSEPPAAPAAPPNVDEALEFALENAPRIVSAEEVQRSTQSTVRAAYGRLSPTVQAFASYSEVEEPSFFQERQEETAFGVRATLPIFQGGSNYSEIRRARRTDRQSRSQITEAVKRVRQEVTSSWAQLQASVATIEAASDAVRSNEIAFEGVRQEANVGSRTTLDVLDAEQELLQARVDLVTAERDAQVAAYQLLAAIGALTPERFGI